MKVNAYNWVLSLMMVEEVVLSDTGEREESKDMIAAALVN